MIKKIIKYFWKSTPFLNYFYPDPKRLKQVSFKKWFLQKILGINRKAYWPTHFTTVVSNPKNILIGKGTLPGGSPGCYIQGIGKIKMGKYVFVGPNVGIISANHDIYDVRKHNKGEVEIGDYSCC